MLNENIKAVRKAKGLSQEELAIKLNVVRQTVSKWEQGLSVPDSDMLVSLSEALETPVSALLGENVSERKTDELKAICEKLEVINLQLAQRKTTKIAAFHCLFIALCATTVLVSAVLEFQRPGDCRFWCGLSCVRVAVCQNRTCGLCLVARRSYYDAKEEVTSESAAPVSIDLFAGLCYNIYGI